MVNALFAGSVEGSVALLLVVVLRWTRSCETVRESALLKFRLFVFWKLHALKQLQLSGFVQRWYIAAVARQGEKELTRRQPAGGGSRHH